MEFIERFKELLNENQLTISDVSVKTGLPRSTVSSYINRKSSPSVLQLKSLANLFGCSIDYLVGRDDDYQIVSSGQSTDQTLSKDEKTMLDAFRTLGPFEREAILIQIKALAGEKSFIKK